MGLFKKIGKAFKKGFKSIGKFAKKNINFKNLVKVGGLAANAIPGVGGLVSTTISGLQDAHYANKAAKKAEGEEKAYYESLAKQQAQQAGANAMTIAQQKGVFGEAMTGAVNQYGAQAIDGSLTTWLKKNWWKVAIGVVGLVVIIFMAVRLSRRK